MAMKKVRYAAAAAVGMKGYSAGRVEVQGDYG
jgi:hypothetical protein